MSLDIQSLDYRFTQASIRVGELHSFQKGKIDPQQQPALDCSLIICMSAQKGMCQLSTTGSRLFRESSAANNMILSTSQHGKTG